MLATLAARSLRQVNRNCSRSGGTVAAARRASFQFGAAAATSAAASAAVRRPLYSSFQRGLEVHSMASPAQAGEASELDVTKRRVREQVKAALRQLSQQQMEEESRLIARRVLASAAFRDSPHAIIYVHCAKLREVDTTEVLHEALEQHKRLYVPRVQDKDANMHFLHLDSLSALQEVPPFGIREPRPTYEDGSERQDVLLVDEPLELVVMPGLAFDRAGRRLGRGGGYYDKFIAAAQQRAEHRGWAPPLLVALAYRAQMVEEVPVEAHDARVDAIVMADEVVACSPAAAAALRPVDAADREQR